MFRKLFGKFRGNAGQEVVKDEVQSTVDAILLLGYRFAGHSRSADTIQAGERQFYGGIHETLKKIGVIQHQVDIQRCSSSFPVLSCDGYVTGNVLPIKISQKAVADRMNPVLPSNIRVFDFIETSPAFDVTKWDGAVCSCYVPTCVLDPTAKQHEGYRASDATLTKLYDASQYIMASQDLSFFQRNDHANNPDVVLTKYKILPSFTKGGYEYLQLSIGFKGCTLTDIERIIGVTLAVARNEFQMDELPTVKSKLGLPTFPRLMLDEVNYEGYNQSLGNSKEFRPIDWAPFQAAQNEFKTKMFLPSIMDRDAKNSFWWNKYIFRPKELEQKTMIIKRDNSNEGDNENIAKHIGQDIVENSEVVDCGIIKESKSKVEILSAGSFSSGMVRNVQPELEIQTPIQHEDDACLLTKPATVSEPKFQIGNEKSGLKITNTEPFSLSSKAKGRTNMQRQVNLNQGSVSEEINDHTPSSMCHSHDKFASSHLEFKTFLSNILEDIDLYLSSLQTDFVEGKVFQKEISIAKVKLNLMTEFPELVDKFWEVERMLDQVTMINKEIDNLFEATLPMFSEMDLAEKMIKVCDIEHSVKEKDDLENHFNRLRKQLAKANKDGESLKSAQQKILNSIIVISRKSESKKRSVAKKVSSDSSVKTKVVNGYVRDVDNRDQEDLSGTDNVDRLKDDIRFNTINHEAVPFNQEIIELSHRRDESEPTLSDASKDRDIIVINETENGPEVIDSSHAKLLSKSAEKDIIESYQKEADVESAKQAMLNEKDDLERVYTEICERIDPVLKPEITPNGKAKTKAKVKYEPIKDKDTKAALANKTDKSKLKQNDEALDSQKRGKNTKKNALPKLEDLWYRIRPKSVTPMASLDPPVLQGSMSF